MMYVPQELQIFCAEKLEHKIQNTPEDKVSPLLLIEIDHFYNMHLSNYEGGLSFLDRANAKIGRFHPDWNIEKMKDRIHASPTPQLEYVAVISQMFAGKGMIAYYGL
jgi:hypothetical protein